MEATQSKNRFAFLKILNQKRKDVYKSGTFLPHTQFPMTFDPLGHQLISNYLKTLVHSWRLS